MNSEPRNNSSSNLSELGLLDFWILPCIKYHMSPLPTLHLVWYLSAVHVTRHPQQRITNTPTTAYIPRLLCARQSFVLTQTRQQQQHHHHQNHHSSTTAAPQQQRSSRDSRRDGGDQTPPATVYVKNKKKEQTGKKQDLPTNSKQYHLLSKNQKP